MGVFRQFLGRLLKFLPLFFSTLGILGIFLRSICPKGWQLPQNSTTVGTKSYSNLLFQAGVIGKIDGDSYTTFGLNILTDTPMSFLRAGYHNTTGTSVYYRGSDGYYWSKSSSSTTTAYYLYFYSSYVYPRANYGTKAHGFTVRCVAL